ncbi:diguanylate cyclase [Pseudomonas sp. dw_358]|uniref:GGDEF domain-containing protein n=1 Tax=Pseudomonas sp. dw_358 TaxID=2720083 RepID=UPI001BD4BAC0|nr:diguanylate cyclase [Pseudomonas sp. dw_358]
MPNPILSILLVTDDLDSAAITTGELRQAGYQDIRLAQPGEAIGLLENQPASLLLVSGEEGLQLATQVRQLDEMGDHYTYILLIDQRPAAYLLDEQADNGIDDVIHPGHVRDHLLPRVAAADRLTSNLQRLRQENRLLRQNIASLEQRNLVDSLTGLGNARYLRQKLADSLRQIQARGGALCYLLIGLQQSAALQREYGSDFYDELLQGVARRLQQMVRPLDILARLDDQHFVLLTLPADLQECAPSSFKRLHEGLNLKGFMTSAGLLDIAAGISLVGLDSRSLPIDPQSLFDEASALLDYSYNSGLVTAKRLPSKL